MEPVFDRDSVIGVRFFTNGNTTINTTDGPIYLLSGDELIDEHGHGVAICSCDRIAEADAQFCDACGRMFAATGATTRL